MKFKRYIVLSTDATFQRIPLRAEAEVETVAGRDLRISVSGRELFFLPGAAHQATRSRGQVSLPGGEILWIFPSRLAAEDYIVSENWSWRQSQQRMEEAISQFLQEQ